MKHFNNLTPAEAERLALLAEEMGEAAQIIGKILRHGYDSYNPTIADSPRNREMLETELGHISWAIGLMCKVNDISQGNIQQHKAVKANKVGRYLHHQNL